MGRRFKGVCALCCTPRPALAWGVCSVCYGTSDDMHKSAERLERHASKAMIRAALARRDALAFRLAVQRTMTTAMGRPFDLRAFASELVAELPTPTEAAA